MAESKHVYSRTYYENRVFAGEIKMDQIPIKYNDHDMKVLANHIHMSLVRATGHTVRYRIRQSSYTYGTDLRSISRRFKTYVMCKVAVWKWGQALKHVPIAFRDRSLCEVAVRACGWALEHVPMEHRDYAMCWLAVKGWGSAIQFAPRVIIDKALCLLAASKGPAIRFIPEDMLDADICLVAAREYDESIKSVPDHILNRNICYASLVSNSKTFFSGHGITNIPERFRDREMYEFAVAVGGSVELVPDEFMDQAMCEMIVRHPAHSLRDLPEKYHNDALYKVAVQVYGSELELVPVRWQTNELILTAICQNPEAMEHVVNQIQFMTWLFANRDVLALIMGQ